MAIVARIVKFGLVGAVLALWSLSAVAGERVALEHSATTVQVPFGWSVMPVSSDAPSLHVAACDPGVTAGCQVLAEMDVEHLLADRRPASLQAVFDATSNMDPVSQATAQRLKVAGREAVETFSLNPVTYDYADGSGETVRMAYRAITLQAGMELYRCSLSVAPKRDSPRWRAALIEFCSSLKVADARSATGKK